MHENEGTNAMGNAITAWVASKVIRKRDGPNNVSTTLVTSRAHGCECGSGGSRGCYGKFGHQEKDSQFI